MCPNLWTSGEILNEGGTSVFRGNELSKLFWRFCRNSDISGGFVTLALLGAGTGGPDRYCGCERGRRGWARPGAEGTWQIRANQGHVSADGNCLDPCAAPALLPHGTRPRTDGGKVLRGQEVQGPLPQGGDGAVWGRG